MVGIRRLKSLLVYYLLDIVKKRGFKRAGIERGNEQLELIKEKEKRVGVITKIFLVSDFIPNFASLPSLPSPQKIIPPLQKTDFGDDQ